MGKAKLNQKIVNKPKLLYLITTIVTSILLVCCKSSSKEDIPQLLNFKEGNYYRTSDSYYENIIGTWVSKQNDGSLFKIVFRNEKKVLLTPKAVKEEIYADVLSGYYCYQKDQSKPCEISFTERSLTLHNVEIFFKTQKADFSFFDKSGKSGKVSFEIVDENLATWELKGNGGMTLVIDGVPQGPAFSVPDKLNFTRE